MLKKDKEFIIEFLMNCYDNKVFDDELSKKEEKMYKKLWELEDTSNKTQMEIYIELENLIAEVLSTSKDRYFDYGAMAQDAALENLTSNSCKEKEVINE